MSTIETSLPLAETEPRLKPGFPAQDKTLEYLTDPKVIASFLHRYQELTDEAFDELVNDIGYRAALLVLRAKALSADVRALDLYIRLCREDKDARRKREAPVERNVHATSFVQAERVQVAPDPAPISPNQDNNNTK